jgi:hypothetical protein
MTRKPHGIVFQSPPSWEGRGKTSPTVAPSSAPAATSEESPSVVKTDLAAVRQRQPRQPSVSPSRGTVEGTSTTTQRRNNIWMLNGM